jgi:hypothetical protein
VIAPYLDASAIIYLVEGAAVGQGLVAQRIVAAEGDPAGRVLTSQLARLECRVKPLRAADAALLGSSVHVAPVLGRAPILNTSSTPAARSYSPTSTASLIASRSASSLVTGASGEAADRDEARGPVQCAHNSLTFPDESS